MSSPQYSPEELERYFKHAENRVTKEDVARRARRWAWTLVLSIFSVTLVALLALFIYARGVLGDIPSTQELENPSIDLATVIMSADSVEIARFGRKNRSWTLFEDISPNVINALVDTEDHRFYSHWGIDLYRLMTVPYHMLRGDRQGASTLTMQLARNLYNTQIGREVTIERKVKEMITAVELERRYTKNEIIEMYLNTVEFGYNAFGIESAARTFYNVSSAALEPDEAAVLVGLLNGITLYNPVRNPENARRRRNVVLSRMVAQGHLSQAYYDEIRDQPVDAQFYSQSITNSIAPHFADYVSQWVQQWAEEQDVDVLSDGLTIYTTINADLQRIAYTEVRKRMEMLQDVVDVEWSFDEPTLISTDFEPYIERSQRAGFMPFAKLFSQRAELTDTWITESPPYRRAVRRGQSATTVRDSLWGDQAYLDSLRAIKTRLETGLVAIDPTTGHIKTWIGGRDLDTDWFDHVASARRQAGSTFKPFVYLAAVENGFSSYQQLRDSVYEYVDVVGNVWAPENSGDATGQLMTLREALARSKNTVTAQLMYRVKPQNVAFYARQLGIESPLAEVLSLGLGTSDVTLLEMTRAYATMANQGIRNEPVAVTRIENRYGQVLYEPVYDPVETLSEAASNQIIDMLRGVIQDPYGTGIRLRVQYQLGAYDLAGKTGTTQNSADGWFMMMHPDLVIGSWVGFNDPRLTFRTDWWGQGAHNALFLVGDVMRTVVDSTEGIITERRFPEPLFLPGPAPSTEEGVVDPNQRRNW